MLRLAAQQEFSRAERYMDKLIDASREEMGHRFTPFREERIRNMQEAFSAFNRSLFYRNDDARRYRLLAEGYLKLLGPTKGVQFEEFAGYTRAAAEKAIALDPGTAGVHKILGLCLSEQADREEDFSVKVKLAQQAMRHIRQELKIRPDDPDCLKAMGFCYYAFNAIPEAVSYYKRYLKDREVWDHGVASEMARIQVMRTDLDEGILEEAVRFAGDAYLSDPLNIDFNWNFAEVLYHAGRIEEAAALLENLKMLDPGSRETYEARIREYQGDE
jgi:tetratricopeptide (TPR) repeat protein